MTTEEEVQLDNIIYHCGYVRVLEHLQDKIKFIDSNAASDIEKAAASLEDVARLINGKQQ